MTNARESSTPDDSRAVIYADGGSRGNPGEAAYGIIVQRSGRTMRMGRALGVATNNEAEYHGLLAGLDWAIKENITDLTVFTDSELVVQQVSGKYKVKHPNLKPLFLQALERKKKIKKFKIFHIKREHNSEADALVNEVLDARERG